MVITTHLTFRQPIQIAIPAVQVRFKRKLLLVC